jgi:hypothetical protein
MGRWCQGVANIGWMERKLASALFATPPESSHQEALEYFLKSHASYPDAVRNTFCIAECYAVLKDNKNAKEWFEKTSKLSGTTDLEKSVVEQATQKAKQY